jgi:hypothetical protein
MLAAIMGSGGGFERDAHDDTDDDDRKDKKARKAEKKMKKLLKQVSTYEKSVLSSHRKDFWHACLCVPSILAYVLMFVCVAYIHPCTTCIHTYICVCVCVCVCT